MRHAEPIGDVGVAQIVLQRGDGLGRIGGGTGEAGQHGGGGGKAHDAHLRAAARGDALVLKGERQLIRKLFHLVHPRPHRARAVDDEHQLESGVARWRERRRGWRWARAVAASARLGAPISDYRAERGVLAVWGELVARGRHPAERKASGGDVTKLSRGARSAGDRALIGDGTLQAVLIGAIARELLTGCGSTGQ